jgi:hypothetical protein
MPFAAAKAARRGGGEAATTAENGNLRQSGSRWAARKPLPHAIAARHTGQWSRYASVAGFTRWHATAVDQNRSVVVRS